MINPTSNNTVLSSPKWLQKNKWLQKIGIAIYIVSSVHIVGNQSDEKINFNQGIEQTYCKKQDKCLLRLKLFLGFTVEEKNLHLFEFKLIPNRA